MLKGITWGQFSIFILAVTGVYYLYVLVCYYKDEVLGLFRKRELSLVNSNKNPPCRVGDKSEGDREPQATENQGELSDGQDDMSDQLPNQSAELFKVMEKVITLLKGVISQGVTSGMDRDEVMGRIEEVLGNYGQLRRTPYQVAINNFLVRECPPNFSMVLDERELDSLWN